jgi:hypothetical protein
MNNIYMSTEYNRAKGITRYINNHKVIWIPIRTNKDINIIHYS